MSTNPTPHIGATSLGTIRVTVTKDAMKAVLVLKEPADGAPEVTVHDVMAALAEAGVVFGIDEALVNETVARKNFDAPIDIAVGRPPVKGADSQIEYLFQTENRFRPQEDKDGRIDYRDMKYIQNVSKGGVLARMEPPTGGVNGMGVDGREITASNGRLVPFNNGENTAVSADGLELTATVDGAIVFARDCVSVKDVMVVNNVDFNVGNIEAVGSLRVSGQICNGFTVKVDGHLEVGGSVEDAKIEARGNVLVRGGFIGAGEGELRSDGDITVKYAVGQRITAGGSVIVGGELVNCHVTAGESVIVKGRRGKIVGGEINARNRIEAAVIGSEAGTQTSLAVAFDAEAMRRYHEASTEIERLKTDDARVRENLLQLYKLQLDGKLNSRQEAGLKKLEEFKNSVPAALEAAEQMKAESEQQLKQLLDSKVVATEIIYPGVKVHVGVLVKEIDEEMKSVELSQDGQRVVANQYKPGQ